MLKVILFSLGFAVTSHTAFGADAVDLSQYFRTPYDHQRGGQCFAYASAALFEAACEQKTGKKVDLSEASLYFNHLRRELSLHYGQTSYNWDMLNFDVDKNPIWDTYEMTRGVSRTKDFLAPEIIGDLTGFDGGSVRGVLEDIVTGNICTETQFPFNDSLETWIRDNFRILGGEEIKKHNDLVGERDSKSSSPITAADFGILHDQYRKMARTVLDDYVSKNVQKDLGLKTGRNQSYGFKSNDPNLKACYDQMPYFNYSDNFVSPQDLIEKLEKKTARRLFSRSKLFACNG